MSELLVKVANREIFPLAGRLEKALVEGGFIEEKYSDGILVGLINLALAIKLQDEAPGALLKLLKENAEAEEEVPQEVSKLEGDLLEINRNLRSLTESKPEGVKLTRGEANALSLVIATLQETRDRIS